MKTCSNGQSVSGYSVNFQVTPFAPPSQISTTANTNTIFISVPQAAGMNYVWQWKPSVNNYWNNMPTSTTNTFRLNNVIPNTKYDIRVTYQDQNKIFTSPFTQTSITTQGVILLNYRIIGNNVEFDANTAAFSVPVKVNGSIKQYGQVRVGHNVVSTMSILKTGDVVSIVYFGQTYSATK